MESQPNELEIRLDKLSARLSEMELRLARIEAAGPVPGADESIVDRDDEPIEAASEPFRSVTERRETLSGLPALIGRSFLILGGAFLLRALTERGVLPDRVGFAAGFGYALIWALVTVRSRGTPATFLGITSAAILFPLVWESTAQFGFISTRTAAFGIVLPTLLALWIAWRGRLVLVAWAYTMAATATSLALLVAQRDPAPFMVVLLVVALSNLWLGYLRGWNGLARLTAFINDILIAVISGLTLYFSDSYLLERLQPLTVVALQLSFVVVYLGTFGLRTLLVQRRITVNEMVQTGIVLILGFGGAVAVTHKTGGSTLALGLTGLLLASGSYGASFAFVYQRAGRGRNFFFYSTLAVIFVLLSLPLLIHGFALDAALLLSSLLAMVIASRLRRVTLTLHAAFYATAAAVSSSLLIGAAGSLFGGAPVPAGWIAPECWLTLVVFAGLLSFPPVSTDASRWVFSLSPRVAMFAVCLAGVGGVIVTLVARQVAGSVASADPQFLAVARTVVLSIAAVFLAWVGRSRRFPEAALLVTPVLLATGVKFLVQDLRAGSSTVLFASMGSYGAALILSSSLRLRRQRHKETGAAG